MDMEENASGCFFSEHSVEDICARNITYSWY